ncbi:MAG TPA: 3-hydroxyacyl-[acyl-carrier-protein] dehydratase FabZ [Clostridiales bacterium]|jgi:3-hydroxyacyl-[acyl-carrier-protein] dehydratase|nr:3-hydroxyacyl-ACP dehydratase FabZ [Clostridia bacterium]HCS72617.1 3-hydroxyacyl-[acyl-carrier-protein] dehydratase FabZ [Clostridiales bacterium]
MYLDINEIMKRIPHRYPFLLVDCVTELFPGNSAKGYKNITINEPFFQGHFPGYPVMPGVLVLEALAQLGAVAVLGSEEDNGRLALFTGIDKVRFRRQVVPGDKLQLEARIIRMKGIMGKAAVRASVDGEVAAEGEIMFALTTRG